ELEGGGPHVGKAGLEGLAFVGADVEGQRVVHRHGRLGGGDLDHGRVAGTGGGGGHGAEGDRHGLTGGAQGEGPGGARQAAGVGDQGEGAVGGPHFQVDRGGVGGAGDQLELEGAVDGGGGGVHAHRGDEVA